MLERMKTASATFLLFFLILLLLSFTQTRDERAQATECSEAR